MALTISQFKDFLIKNDGVDIPVDFKAMKKVRMSKTPLFYLREVGRSVLREVDSVLENEEVVKKSGIEITPDFNKNSRKTVLACLDKLASEAAKTFYTDDGILMRKEMCARLRFILEHGNWEAIEKQRENKAKEKEVKK